MLDISKKWKTHLSAFILSLYKSHNWQNFKQRLINIYLKCFVSRAVFPRLYFIEQKLNEMLKTNNSCCLQSKRDWIGRFRNVFFFAVFSVEWLLISVDFLKNCLGFLILFGFNAIINLSIKNLIISVWLKTKFSFL